jgi:hypothetical protein
MARRKHKTSIIASHENLSPEKLFHITVGTALQWQGTVDLTHELRLLKAALLYADKVKLCSLASSIIVTLAQYKNLSDDEKLEVAVAMFLKLNEIKNDNSEQVTYLVNMLKLLQKDRRIKKELEKRLPHKEFMLLYKLDKWFREMIQTSKRAFQEGVAKVTDGVRVDELEAALRTGLIEFHWVQPSGDNVVQEFFNVVADAVTSGKTYPLFDDMTGGLVSAAIKEHKLTPADASIGRAKSVGLSADLFSRLPLFDNASVSEIIDIRKELDKPLIRFRSAITGFSSEIESASWDKEFTQECDQLFHEKVAPTILEIEEACKANKRLTVYFNKVFDEKVILGASALGMLLASASELPNTIAQFIPVTAGVAAVLYKAEKDWREKYEQIEKNQLYFYYKAGELLQQ